jgi:hypothetical protein
LSAAFLIDPSRAISSKYWAKRENSTLLISARSPSVEKKETL